MMHHMIKTRLLEMVKIKKRNNSLFSGIWHDIPTNIMQIINPSLPYEKHKLSLLKETPSIELSSNKLLK